MGHQWRGSDYQHRDETIMELAGPPNNLCDREIGKIVGLSRVRILQIRHKYLKQHVGPLTEFYKNYQTDICLRGLEPLLPRLDAGDKTVAGAVNIYMTRLAKLHGTDAPEVQQHDFSFQWKEKGFNFRNSSVIEGETVDE